MVMRDKIALADLKFPAHQARHLLNRDGMLAHNAPSLFSGSRESNRREIVILVFKQVDDRDTKTGAGADDGHNALQHLIEAHFCSKYIAQANQLFDLTRA